MEKVFWSRKRLRIFLALNRPIEQADIEAYALLNAFVQSFPRHATNGDRSLLKACKNIELEQGIKVNEESRSAIEKLGAEIQI